MEQDIINYVVLTLALAFSLTCFVKLEIRKALADTYEISRRLIKTPTRSYVSQTRVEAYVKSCSKITVLLSFCCLVRLFVTASPLIWAIWWGWRDVGSPRQFFLDPIVILIFLFAPITLYVLPIRADV